MRQFIEGLPKAELHIHIEGTLEPEHCLELANRNGIALQHNTPEAIVRSYDFNDLPSFLSAYYSGMQVLLTEQDFYDLTCRYFQKAASEGVVYAEVFFDPQAHTSRGVDFETVISGIHRAQKDARQELGIESGLIMCFLRDMSAESAMEHLHMSLPYKHWIIGVGLDSDERDNPPSKFAEVFIEARKHGFRLTMHCDVNQQDSLLHIRECLDKIGVDRIDHGVNVLEDEELCLDLVDLVDRGIGLTICPVSNHYVVQSFTSEEIRSLISKGVKVTVNSDDPAYFRAYINENFQVLAEEGDFSQQEIVQLTKNAFDIAWLSDDVKVVYLKKLENYVASFPSSVVI